MEYTKDYRDLRKGTIGSTYQYEQDILNEELPGFIVSLNKKLSLRDSTKAKSVAKYFLDIGKVMSKSKKLLKQNGRVVFIIGNQKYKGILINNLKFFIFLWKKMVLKAFMSQKEKLVQKILPLIGTI